MMMAVVVTVMVASQGVRRDSQASQKKHGNGGKQHSLDLHKIPLLVGHLFADGLTSCIVPAETRRLA